MPVLSCTFALIERIVEDDSMGGFKVTGLKTKESM